MAGAILVSENAGVSLSSGDFYYMVEKIKGYFADGDAHIRDEIYSPVDEGGMTFISLKEQSEDGFNAFVRAVWLAYACDIKEDPLLTHRSSWEELMSILAADLRAGRT